MDNTMESNNFASGDNSPKVTGIGGIFFYADDLEQTRAWYAKNLGFDINNWGSVGFNAGTDENGLQWCLFKKADQYFAPSEKSFMINYRVRHLEKLVEQLRANGVTIVDEMAQYDYGKFIHILDCDGNKIELWEPA